jgi:DMSO/TMAO reductase YedYZ molybdopterin-dependent catalytic subunit
MMPMSAESSNEPAAVLRIDGEVERPVALTFADLEALEEKDRVRDVSRFDPKRHGDAISLLGLLALVGPRDSAVYLGLHGTLDNFHASIPLAPVRDRGLVIYRRDGAPLPVSAGGPFRFFIPDYAACHAADIDECANVKFVDHLELTAERGFDNRPQDDESHQRLHQHGG